MSELKKTELKSKKNSHNLGKFCQKCFHQPIITRLIIVVGVAVIVLFSICLFFNLTYAQTIFPHTYVGGVDLSNKTYGQAKEILNQKIQATTDKTLEVRFDLEKDTVSASEIGLTYDLQKNLDLAWSVGRQGNLARIIKEQVYAIFSFNRKSAIFLYNETLLNQKISDHAKKVDVPEQDATVAIKNLVPSIKSEQTGKQIDQALAKKEIEKVFANFFAIETVQLQTQEIKPKVTADSANDALALTKQILTNTINIKAKDKSFALEPKDFASWIKYQPNQELISRNWVLKASIDKDLVGKYVDDLSKQVNQDAKDAKFSVENGHVTTFQVEQTGYELDQQAAVAKISEAILGSNSKLDLTVKTITPDIKSDSVTTNGIKELVAEGATSWKGSPANRIHNLTLGSKNISGTIVKPGEEFSTIKAIGPIDTEHGFLKELVIKNGNQVVPDVGGGLCQVSTTLFRAAMNAGLKITERTNHSFRVSYYEPPVGMDATIYDPKPDFRFVNNMSTPILVWATSSENGLSFQIYGAKDGRTSEISDPVLSNYIDPPDPIYTETDTMDPGAIRQVERATRGVTATFHYKVTAKDGEVLQDQNFVSKYIPIANTFLYGPGADVPNSNPAPTPTPTPTPTKRH